MTPAALPPDIEDTPSNIEVEQSLTKSNRKQLTLFNISKGVKRYRFNYSFYSCPPTDSSGQPDLVNAFSNEPAVDFDVALCLKHADECLVVSDTLDDTNEGFDVLIPPRYHTEDLVLHIIKPAAEDITPCRGPGGEQDEPWHWASLTWR